MASMADSLGQPIPFDWQGQHYDVRLIDQRAKAWFERWCEKQVRDTLAELHGVLPPDAYREAVASYSQQRAAKEFTWGHPTVMKMLTSPGGALAMMAHLMESTNPQTGQRILGVTDATMNAIASDPVKGAELVEVWKQVVEASLPGATAQAGPQKGQPDDPLA